MLSCLYPAFPQKIKPFNWKGFIFSKVYQQAIIYNAAYADQKKFYLHFPSFVSPGCGCY
jgi:hypothetical protein